MSSDTDNTSKTVAYWIKISEYDLKVAEAMLEKGHYLYVGFMCHQSVEKMLKAVFVAKNKTVPPYMTLLIYSDLKNQGTRYCG